jgi:Cof subfamily protein (haloacid dehalogenase superfamily)
MQSKKPLEGILLISDMDGTLITKNFHLPERNTIAIDRFIKKGGYFSVATGRPEYALIKYLDNVKLNAPAIVYNGSVIYDINTNKTVWYACLPQSIKRTLKTIMNEFKDVGVEIYAEGCVYIARQNEWTKNHIINENLNYRISDVENAPKQWYKLLLSCDNKRLQEVFEFVKTQVFEGFYFVFTNIMFLEVLPFGVSKGSTLERLSKILNITHENIVAIGDYYNDLEILQTAGLGVAVEGSPEEVVKVADITVGSCEGGAVADIIEYLEEKYNCR